MPAPLKLAFTSCMDSVNYPGQPGWDDLARETPDVLVLLGDSIYMDYGWGKGHADEPNGSPKDLKPADFSHRMHQRYRAQYGVPAFRDAIRGRQVHAIWDDHDFAWNNSRGAGPQGDALVSRQQRHIATAHLQAWRGALATQPDSYPADMVDSAAPSVNDRGIGGSVTLQAGRLYLHLLDGRSFRDGDDTGAPGQTLFGHDQRHAVEELFHQQEEAVHLLAIAEPLEKWRGFVDAQWLLGWAQRRHVLVISGDVHEPQYTGYKANGNKDWGKKDKTVLHEFTASAMAQGPTGFFGKKRNVFGTLTFGDSRIEAALFHGSERLARYAIDRDSWAITELPG